MAKNKALNNMLYFYKESGCRSLKIFAQKYNLSYNTFTEQIRRDVAPTEETILSWCIKCHLPRTYFDQERPELSYDDLNYWHHHDVRYTLDEFCDAMGMVAEDFQIDRKALELALLMHRPIKQE